MYPFHAGSLVSGKDYQDTVIITPASFPNATLFTWRYPDTPSPSVYGFLDVSYGDMNNTNPATPIVPRQIKISRS